MTGESTYKTTTEDDWSLFVDSCSEVTKLNDIV